MFEFAKRAMFESLDMNTASASSAFAAFSARSRISKEFASIRILLRPLRPLCGKKIHPKGDEGDEGSPHFYIPEARRRRPMRHAHRLHRIAFATIRQPPDL